MVEKVLQKMIFYYEKDVRRINHALKVYSYASSIARLENLSEKETLIVDLSAILHDIGIKVAEVKYNSSNGRYQELEGPSIAREILAEFNLSKEVADRICYLIGNHHSYQKIDGSDFQILIEADFLVNIDEDHISKNSVENIRKKYFKTRSGISLLESIYL